MNIEDVKKACFKMKAEEVRTFVLDEEVTDEQLATLVRELNLVERQFMLTGREARKLVLKRLSS